MSNRVLFQQHLIDCETSGVQIEEDLELFPAFFHINYIKDSSIKYLDERACHELGMTMEEVCAQGPQFLVEKMHPNDIERCLTDLQEFVKRNNPDEIFTYFQRIKLDSNSSEYVLCITSVKLNLIDETFSCVSNKISNLDTKGELILFDAKISHILDQYTYTKKMLPLFLSLTKREKEIITLLCEGYSSPTIAEKLFISEHTVKKHRKNIYAKLPVKRFSEVLEFADTFNL